MKIQPSEHRQIYLILLALIVILIGVNIQQNLIIDTVHHEVTDLQLKNSEQEAFIRYQRQLNIDLDKRITVIEAQLP